jgi:DNA polymerase III subunit epsilon
MDVRDAVSKNLDLLVVADPDSMSGKAKKARTYGTRIMSERAFWKALRIAVD